MSRDCHVMSPVVSHKCVATCHQDVTAESHICHKLSQGVTTAVTSITPSHRVSKHLLTCRHVDISWLRGGVPPLGSVDGPSSRASPSHTVSARATRTRYTHSPPLRNVNHIHHSSRGRARRKIAPAAQCSGKRECAVVRGLCAVPSPQL